MTIGRACSLFSVGLRRRMNIAARILPLIVLLWQPVAWASFIGVYGPGNWTLTNTDADGTATFGSGDATLMLVGGNTGTGLPGSTDFLITVPLSGAIQLQYNYSSLDLPTYDFAGYLLGGSFVQLADTDGEHGTVQ